MKNSSVISFLWRASDVGKYIIIPTCTDPSKLVTESLHVGAKENQVYSPCMANDSIEDARGAELSKAVKSCNVQLFQNVCDCLRNMGKITIIAEQYGNIIYTEERISPYIC